MTAEIKIKHFHARVFLFHFTLSDCASLPRKTAVVILVITFAYVHEETSSVIMYFNVCSRLVV